MVTIGIGSGEHISGSIKDERKALDGLMLRRVGLRAFYIIELFIIFPTVVGRLLGVGVVLACVGYALVKCWNTPTPAADVVGSELETPTKRQRKVGAELWMTLKLLGGYWYLLFFVGWLLVALAVLSRHGWNVWPGLIRYYIVDRRIYWTFDMLLFHVNHAMPTWVLAARLVIVAVGTLGVFVPLRSYDYALMLETEIAQVRNARPRPVELDTTGPGGVRVHTAGHEEPAALPDLRGASAVHPATTGDVIAL